MKTSQVKVFNNINKLFSFSGFSKKEGRHVQLDDMAVVTKAAMVVKDGRILWVGPEKKLPQEFKKKKTISLNKKNIYPAFLECHTHLVFAGQRADEFELRNTGVSYQEIAEKGGGIKKTVLATREASVAKLKLKAEKRLQRFIHQGVTTVETKSGYGLAQKYEEKILSVSKKINNARVINTYLGPHSLPIESIGIDKYLDQCVRGLKAIKLKKLAKRADIFIEKGFFTVEHARKYLSQAKHLGFDLVVHAEQLSHSGGTRLALEMDATSVDHLVHITDGEIRDLAQSNTTAVLLPSSDFYLKINYPPARKLIDEGARVALATDFNPGSSPTQDLALVGLLARTEMKMSLAEVFCAYTMGAAYALNLHQDLGSLDVGKFADFLVTEADYADFFYHIGHTPTQEVYKEGECIFLSHS